MRIARKLPEVLEIRGDHAVGSAALIGVAFLVIPVGFWLTSPHAQSPERLGAALTLFLLGLLLLKLGFNSGKRGYARKAPPRLELDRTETRIQPGAHLRLVAARGAHGSLANGYGVELVGQNQASQLVLMGRDPAPVLADALELARFLEVPLQSGWGLPAGRTPWPLRAPDDPRPADPSSSIEGTSAERRTLAVIVALGAVGAALVFGFEIRARIVLGETPSLLSVTLPALLVLLLLVFSGVLATTRDTLIVTDSHLSFERRIAGIAVRRVSVELENVKAVHPVGPAGTPRHVLLETERGPFSLPLGDDLAANLGAAIAAARQRGDGGSPRH